MHPSPNPGMFAAPETGAYRPTDLSQFTEAANQLLGKMTIEEKVGQMVQVDSAALKDKEDVRRLGLGSVLSGGNSDPDQGSSPKAWRDFVLQFKSQALKTRLKIPLLYGIDAVHGHNNVDGAVIFPHQIGLGASGNPGLVRLAAQITAREMAATGIRWAFSPCVAVPLNPSWGRTYEGYGDQTNLVSQLGQAAVLGLQGESLSPSPLSILACAKHFIGDGGTAQGIDQGDATLDEAALRALFLPPYKAAIKAGVGSIMVSYNSWQGTKLHCHKHLLTGVLKDELGFLGFLVSDWAAIDQITTDYKKAVELSIMAGLDMVMIPNGPDKPNNYLVFIRHLLDLVRAGMVPEPRIDDAVRRILRVKLAMGLFDEDIPDPSLIEFVGCPAHRDAARHCVRQSLVLIKNKDHLLPLSSSLQNIAVVGNAADDLGIQCGGWTMDWQGGHGNIISGGTTLLNALRQKVPHGADIFYSPDASNLGHPDVVVVVLGENPYAEMKGDRQQPALSREDHEIVSRACQTDSPVVTVLYSGRALILGQALTQSQAFVAAWLPGTEGLGITDVLFGSHPFTGKLPRHWPEAQESIKKSCS